MDEILHMLSFGRRVEYKGETFVIVHSLPYGFAMAVKAPDMKASDPYCKTDVELPTRLFLIEESKAKGVTDADESGTSTSDKG